MKRIILSLMFLLIFCVSVALAALTKTTSIIELDAWQRVLPGVLAVGAAGSISDSYETILYLEIAYADADAQDGVEVGIEVSYGDDNWTLLTPVFTTPDSSTTTSTTTSGVTAGDTTIPLTSGFGEPGEKMFIEDDDDDAFSESFRVKSRATNTITLCHDLLRSHTTAANIWRPVQEYVIPIPAAFAFVRVIINNVDANSDIFYTTRISKVTGL